MSQLSYVDSLIASSFSEAKRLTWMINQKVTFLPKNSHISAPRESNPQQRVIGVLKKNGQHFLIEYHNGTGNAVLVLGDPMDAASNLYDVQLENPSALFPSASPLPLISDIRELIAHALSEAKIGQYLEKGELKTILRSALLEIPDEVYDTVVILMEQFGIVPNRETNNRTINRAGEADVTTVLRDPDGVVLQCARLGYSARAIGTLLSLSDAERDALNVAGVLVNSAKADVMWHFQKDLDKHKGREPDDCACILRLYEKHEADVLDVMQNMGGLPEDVISLLKEQIRHNPSTLQSLSGKILYYLLHCQNPNRGELVSVKTRINASISRHPQYGVLYKGYTRLNDKKDLVDVHYETVAAIEEELTRMLRVAGHAFTDLKTFLNDQLGFIPPAPPVPAQ